jgi:hypothetical protein
MTVANAPFPDSETYFQSFKRYALLAWRHRQPQSELFLPTPDQGIRERLAAELAGHEEFTIRLESFGMRLCARATPTPSAAS